MVTFIPAISANEAAGMSSAALRSQMVLAGLFKPGQISLNYWETDRTIIGGAVPTRGALELSAPDEIRSQYFNERRELGIINVGGPGSIRVDGRKLAMGHLDTLYAGRGVKRISFASNSPKKPARFYLLSYPAHATHPTRRLKLSELTPRELGSKADGNHRLLHQVIHAGGIQSCQLVMGFTIVKPGSKWNTMPPHTHMRRSEVYCYFDFPRGGSVKHFFGHPKNLRTFQLKEGQAALSPPWSLHCGEGTSHYGFIWGMGGENQDYTDMTPVDPKLIHQAR